MILSDQADVELETCPFCLGTDHYEDVILVRGSRTLYALKHARSCPRFRRCGRCAGDAVTGMGGCCYACAEAPSFWGEP